MVIKEPVKKYFSLSLYRSEAESLTAYLKTQGKDFESYVKALVLKDLMHSEEVKHKMNFKKGDNQ